MPENADFGRAQGESAPWMMNVTTGMKTGAGMHDALRGRRCECGGLEEARCESVSGSGRSAHDAYFFCTNLTPF